MPDLVPYESLADRLNPEALEMLSQMASAHIEAESGDRLFIRAESFAGTDLLFVSDRIRKSWQGFDAGALEDLVAYGLLHRSHSARGTPNYRLSSEGLAFLRWLEARGQDSSSAASAPSYELPADVEEPHRVRVAISYSHDSQSHKDRVLRLANQLRQMGVDVRLDQYAQSPPEGWPNWMQSQIEESTLVLAVCTPTYLERVTGAGDPQVGRGSRYEGLLISQEIFEGGGRNSKFLPVVFHEDHLSSVPPWLRPFTHFDLSSETGFEALYRFITNQPEIVAPPLGEVVDLPTRQLSLGEPWGALDPVGGQTVTTPEPLPGWHIDMAVNWHQEGGATRFAISWTPGIGFTDVDPSDHTLEVTGAGPPPSDLPINSIAVSYLPEDRLRFDFSHPITPVIAKLHIGGEVYQPRARGGGASHYYEFRLSAIPGL